MFEKLDLVDKLNKELKGRGKTYIGYDLGAGYGEISVFTEGELNPVTLLSRKDATVFHFPCMLVKYNGRFYAGFEAASLAGEEGALVFEDLLDIAMNQSTIVVGGQRFDTEYLLTLFLKLTLVLPDSYGKIEKVGGIMFTTYIDEDPALQNRVYEVLTKAASQIFGRRTRLYLQTRSESIYYFLMHQEESMLMQNTLVCDYQKDFLKTYYVKKHGLRAPYTVSVERTDYPDMRVVKLHAEEITLATGVRHIDQTFHRVIMDLENKYDFGLSYMLGDGFKGGWMDQSLNQLCEHGRVFQGNNLYSLGACYCLKQIVEPTQILEDYVYLSKQDNRYDVGIYCFRQGMFREYSQPEYIPIFERGSAVEDCSRSMYLLPEGEEELVVELKALSEPEPKLLRLDLSDFPQRKAGQSKIKLTLKFLDTDSLEVCVEDVGLGQVAPGSGKVIRETFQLE